MAIKIKVCWLLSLKFCQCKFNNIEAIININKRNANTEKFRKKVK